MGQVNMNVWILFTTSKLCQGRRWTRYNWKRWKTTSKNVIDKCSTPATTAAYLLLQSDIHDGLWDDDAVKTDDSKEKESWVNFVAAGPGRGRGGVVKAIVMDPCVQLFTWSTSRQSSKRPEHHVRPFHPYTHTRTEPRTVPKGLTPLRWLTFHQRWRGRQRDTFPHLPALFPFKKKLCLPFYFLLITFNCSPLSSFISLFLQIVSFKKKKQQQKNGQPISFFLLSSCATPLPTPFAPLSPFSPYAPVHAWERV